MANSTGATASAPQPTLSKSALAATISELAGFGALALLFFYYLPLSGALRTADPWAPERVVALILLFVGLVLVFTPPGIALRLGPVAFLSAGSWTLAGYVLIFVPPPLGPDTGFFTYVAALTLAFVALASLFALLAAAVGGPFLPEPAGYLAWVGRAARQGSLVALFGVSLLAMSPMGALNWLNALLVFSILALTELFFLARR